MSENEIKKGKIDFGNAEYGIWELNGDTLTISWNGNDNSPKIIKKAPSVPFKELFIKGGVTEIGESAFHGCKDLEIVHIQEGVVKIGYYAFASCPNLKSIEIPEGVTTIDEMAFNECPSLKDIVFPKSLMCIGAEALETTKWYEFLPDGDIYVNSCYYKYKGVMPENYMADIADGTKVICSRAFENQSELVSVKIPSSIITIDKRAFKDCLKLTTIDIPEGVLNIGSEAFNRCSHLENINIADSVISVGALCFNGTKWKNDQTNGLLYLKHILISYKGFMPDNCELELKEGTRVIADMALTSNRDLVSIKLPESLIYIGKNALESTSIETLVIPSNVQVIGSRAFQECALLSTVEMSDKVVTIGDEAFSSCKKLKSINLSSSLKSIGYGAFKETKLKDVIIPEGINIIENSMFSHCKSLKTIKLPENLKYIDAFSFWECKALKSINIPNSVTTIGNEAFANCSKLENLCIPNGVVTIGDCAFCYIPTLTSIEFPSSVNSIGDGAFSGCCNLNEVILRSYITNEGFIGIFNNEKEHVKLLISSDVVENYKQDPKWTDYQIETLK